MTNKRSYITRRDQALKDFSAVSVIFQKRLCKLCQLRNVFNPRPVQEVVHAKLERVKIAF
jgi:hypothetical protein